MLHQLELIFSFPCIVCLFFTTPHVHPSLPPPLSLRPHSCGHFITDPSQCRCATGYVYHAASDQCKDTCITQGKAAVSDGSECVECSFSFDLTRNDCKCPEDHIIVERDAGGTLYTQKACVACPNNTQVIAPDYYTCQSCPNDNFKMLSDGTCVCEKDYLLSGNDCLRTNDVGTITTQYNPSNAALIRYRYVRRVDGGSSEPVTLTSYFVSQTYTSQAVNCQLYQNRTACNGLLNICAMHGYHPDATPCLHFANLEGQGLLGNTHGFGDWKETLPWYDYGDDRDVLNSNLKSEVSLTMVSADDFADRQRVHVLKFMLASYAADGTFLGLDELAGQLQLCDGTDQDKVKWRKFGTNFENRCSINLNELMAKHPTTTFYDLYYVDAEEKLYPVSVKILNYEDGNNDQPNLDIDGDEDMEVGSLKLHRRFFVVDTQSGATSADGTPEIISYARKITLRVTMQSDSTELIYPPTLTVYYAQRRTSTIAEGGEYGDSYCDFQVIYVKDMGSFHTAVEVLFSFAIIFAVFFGSIKVFVYQKSNQIVTIDLSFFANAIIIFANELSSWFMYMLFFLTAYCFIFFKGQSTVYLLLPLESSRYLEDFEIFVIFIFVGKLGGLIQRVWGQCKAELFFVDWEEPRVLRPDGSEQLLVSTWRKLFVSNKWNDIMNDRDHNVPLTLLTMLFLLEGLGLEYLATAQPDSSLDQDSAPIHIVLQYPVHVFFFALLGGLQLLYTQGIVHRFVADKVSDFIDLLSIANISVFIFDQRLHAFYLHGRTVQPTAETNLHTLINSLSIGREHWVTQRGLYDGKDTFHIFVTDEFREKYDDLYTQMIEGQYAARLGARRAASAMAGGREMNEGDVETAITARLVKASESLNTFLSTFLDRRHEWQPGERSFLENRFEIPPKIDPRDPCLVVEDPEYMFTNTILAGIEWDILLTLIATFTFCDVAFGNTFVSAFFCFFVDMIMVKTRTHFGKINLSKKTLIDKRFLI